jgi:antitoxin FitA
MAKVVQVRDVPDEVHAALTRQADRAGLSLNRFVLTELERIARRERNAEIFAEAAQETGRRPSTAQIVAAIREERDGIG